MLPDNPYDEAFYSNQVDGSTRSAEVLVPLLLGKFPRISSVVDIGCGVGAWLSVFKKQGVGNITGFDGGQPEELLQIPSAHFNQVDLDGSLPSTQKYDLAMSLEVAEHLKPERAATFVADLCSLSDIVMFGAAVPGQGGTRHINEQWPTYWTKLFKENGFNCFDIIRPLIWSNDRVEWWYAQNTFIFINAQREDLISSIRGLPASPIEMQNCVHPGMLQHIRASCESLEMRLLVNENRKPIDFFGGWVRAFAQLEFASFLCTLGFKDPGEPLWNNAKQYLTSVSPPLDRTLSKLNARIQLHVAELLCTMGQPDIGTLLWNHATRRLAGFSTKSPLAK